MASIIATLKARPGQESKLEGILRELVAATGTEPGAVVYEVLRPRQPGDAFTVYERYQDERARELHLGSKHLQAALAKAEGCLAETPTNVFLEPLATIRQEQLRVAGRPVAVTILPIGPVNLVYAQTPKGLLACGAIDPAALERFGVAAARVKPSGASVATFADLLAATVREANAPAAALGIQPGMTGADALARL